MEALRFSFLSVKLSILSETVIAPHPTAGKAIKQPQQELCLPLLDQNARHNELEPLARPFIPEAVKAVTTHQSQTALSPSKSVH